MPKYTVQGIDDMLRQLPPTKTGVTVFDALFDPAKVDPIVKEESSIIAGAVLARWKYERESGQYYSSQREIEAIF